MKITINEEVCKKHNLSVEETIGLLFVRLTQNAHKEIDKLINDEKVVNDLLTDEILITQRWNDEVDSIILESDDSIPNEEELRELASKMREMFPKGFKIGSAAWRGNVRELTIRLQKFYKLYGNYKPEEILDATKRYVQSFNGDYTKMRILKYFILKHDPQMDEDGIRHVEDISDLANFLENDCVDDKPDDWMIELR